MRRVAAKFRQFLLGTTGALVLVVPTVSLAFWSSAYLWQIYSEATSPGRPVVFQYKGAKGWVVVTADSVSVEPGQQVVEAFGLRIRTPAGEAIRARRLMLVRRPNGAMKIDVFDVHAKVIRDSKSEFSVQDLFPAPSEDKGPEPAFDVRVHGVRLDLQDESRQPRLNLFASAEKLSVVGKGSEMVIRTDLRLPSNSPIPTRLQLRRDNWYALDFDLKDADIAPLLPMAKRYFSDADLKTAGVIGLKQSAITGGLRIEGRTNGFADAYGTMVASLSEVTVGDSFRRQNVSGRFSLRGNALTGAFQTQYGTAVGGLDWGKDLRAAAELDLKLAARPNQLRDIPEFKNARFKGAFSYANNAWRIGGDLAAAEIKLPEATLREVSATVDVSDAMIRGRNVTLTVEDTAIEGAVDYIPKTRGILGVAKAKRINLRRFEGLSGLGSGEAVVTGTLDKPILAASLSGTASYQGPQTLGAISGLFEARVRGTKDTLKLTRGVFRSKDGAIAVDGTLRNFKHLDLTMRGTNVQLSRFQSSLKGEGYFIGSVTGTVQSPKISAEIETYQLQANGVTFPYARLTAKLNGDVLEIPKAIAEFGLANATGGVTVNLKSGTIRGKFESAGIPLSEALNQPELFGRVALKDGVISGTLKDPRYSATAYSGALSSGKSWAQYAGAQISGDSKKVAVRNGRVLFGDSIVSSSPAENPLLSLLNSPLTPGMAQFDGDYEFADRKAQFQAEWFEIPLRSLYGGDPRADLTGTISGTGRALVADGSVTSGQADVSVQEAGLNGGSIGVGSASFTVRNDVVTGSGSIGKLGDTPRFIELADLNVDLKNKTATSKIFALNLQTENLVRLAKPLLKDNAEAERLTQSLSALLNGEIDVFWDGTDVNYDLVTAELDEIHFAGRQDGGKVVAAGGKKRGNQFSLEALTWTTKDSILQASGTQYDGERLSSQVSGQNIDLSWALAYDPTLPAIPAELDDIDLLISGEANNPTVEGNFTLRGLARRLVTQPDGSQQIETTNPISVMVYGLNLYNNQLTAQHSFLADGFAGEGELRGDVRAFQDGDHSMRLTARANERSLTEFQNLLTSVDFERSEGKVGGFLEIEGNVKQYAVNGQAQLNGSKLAVKGQDTALSNPKLTVTTDGKVVTLAGQGESSAGGSLALALRVPQPNDFSRTLDEILAETQFMEGSGVTLNDFTYDQRDEPLKYLVTAATRGPISITGSLAEPLIKGTVDLKRVDSDVPVLEPGGGGPLVLPVNPRFDIQVVTSAAANIRASLAQLTANANTRITGTLTNPSVQGGLAVEGGSLRLPNARVVLDENGVIEFNVRPLPGGDLLFQAPVNLIGRTSVTAQGRAGSSYERYDITLIVTGDLLGTEPLNIQASSDPGDLSQQEILAIIGQQDLIQSLSSIARDPRSNLLGNSILTYALPQLTEGFTQGLATAFSLDYLAIEYNALEGPAFVGAKTFSKTTSIQLRRAIPLNTIFPDFWEVKLVYRVPSSNPLLSRSRITLSKASERPIRLGLEYSIRF